MKPSLLILAAGLGSRYGGFKQIDPIGPNGEIILDYSIFDAIRAGFGRVVLIARPELETPMREHFAETLGDRLDLQFVFQRMDDLPVGYELPADRQKPWGTAHAIWAAREAMPGGFGVINADDFYGPDSYRLLFQSLDGKPRGDVSLVGFELAKTLSAHGSVSRGICRVDEEGYLVDVLERTKIVPDGAGAARCEIENGSWIPLAGDAIASMNMWGFDGSVMAELERMFTEFLAENLHAPKAEFYIPSAVDALIKEGKSKCRVLRSGEQWFGMTYPEDREAVVASIRSLIDGGRYPSTLAVGL